MIEKAFETIGKDDIEQLIHQQVCEKRTIEYKQMLPGKSDADTREFLADVSSFANASGGDILYGVSAKDGIPMEVVGINSAIDGEILRLENIIRTGVDPRLPSVQIRAIVGFKEGSVILIRVGKSWLSPHIVKYLNHSRFFTRTSAGKSQMDVVELRSAFLSSNSITQEMKQFRNERMAKIISGETPVPVDATGCLVLHLLPMSAFVADGAIDIVRLGTGDLYMPPLSSSGYDRRINFDGVLFFTKNTYCQVYRNGCVEGVGANLLYKDEGENFCLGSGYEVGVVNRVGVYANVLRQLQIPCPITISVSLIGVKGAKITMKGMSDDFGKIDRDVLMLPEILVNDFESITTHKDIAKLLHPVFNIVWNASGGVGSHNYNEQGEWRHK